MPQPAHVTLATLKEIWKDNNNQATPGPQVVTVQFNPQTLKVSYSNRTSGGDEPTPSGKQSIGRNTTRLSLELWFDVTAPARPEEQSGGGASVPDVRDLTEEVSYFLMPKPKTVDGETKQVLPGVRFQWGTFLFDGVMDSMDETLEYFSADGRPLRASVSIALSKNEVGVTRLTSGMGAGLSPGATPLFQARLGDTVQQVAARAGLPDWKGIALGNGIENPRLLAPGSLVDLTLRAPTGSASAGIRASFTAGLGGR